MTIAAMLLLVLGTSGCSTNENVESENEPSGVENTGDSQETTYSYDDFTEVSIAGFVHAYIGQGKDYAIRVIESPNPKVKTIVEKKGDKLNIYTKSKEKNTKADDAPSVYVTLPVLKKLVGSGATKTKMAFAKNDDLVLDFSGASSADFEDMKCAGLSINCSGASNMSFGKVECSSLRSILAGASKMTLEAKANGSIYVDNSGASKLKLTLSGASLKVLNSGASYSDLTFKGATAEISSSGAGNIDLEVNCEELTASNSGAAKITVSGTADKTNINSSGASKINTKKLNQF